MYRHFFQLVALIPLGVRFLTAQAVDDTQLKQVVIFGRHSVRAPVAPNAYLNNFAVQQFPDFGVAAGILTPNGETLETILGGYYRLWLTQEGLLTGDDTADANFVFFHANAIQRTVDTAQHFWSGLLPAAPINVDYLTPSTASDPLFDPVGAGVAVLNSKMAIASIQGRLGDNPQVLASAYAPEFALTRSVLLGYPASQTPVPPVPANVTDVTDFTAAPIAVTAGTQGVPIALGGLSTVSNLIDPFTMEYADGLPAGWDQLTAGGVSQTSRISNLVLNLEFRTPYLTRVQSSNVASHIVRSLVQAATRGGNDRRAGNSVNQGRRFDRVGRQSLRPRRPVPTRLAPAGIPTGLLWSGRRSRVATSPVANHWRVRGPCLLYRADLGPVAESNSSDARCAAGQRPSVYPRLQRR